MLTEGDVVAFPRGKDGAHQIINRTDTPVRVLMLSSMVGPDIVDHVDSGKVYATDLAGEPIMFSRPAAPCRRKRHSALSDGRAAPLHGTR